MCDLPCVTGSCTHDCGGSTATLSLPFPHTSHFSGLTNPWALPCSSVQRPSQIVTVSVSCSLHPSSAAALAIPPLLPTCMLARLCTVSLQPFPIPACIHADNVAGWRDAWVQVHGSAALTPAAGAGSSKGARKGPVPEPAQEGSYFDKGHTCECIAALKKWGSHL
jgi:hypothetical protein